MTPAVAAPQIPNKQANRFSFVITAVYFLYMVHVIWSLRSYRLAYLVRYIVHQFCETHFCDMTYFSSFFTCHFVFEVALPTIVSRLATAVARAFRRTPVSPLGLTR